MFNPTENLWSPQSPDPLLKLTILQLFVTRKTILRKCVSFKLRVLTPPPPSTVTSKTVFMDVYVDDGNYDNLSGQDTSLNEEDAVAKNIKTLDVSTASWSVYSKYCIMECIQ